MARDNRKRLNSVTVRGYKSISYEHPVTLHLGDVSILLGANGAGKSNLISFFRMLSYMMSSSFGKYVEMNGTSNALLYYGPKKTPTISANLEFSDRNSTSEYSFTLANASPDRLIITEERILWRKYGNGSPYVVVLEPNFKETALKDSEDRIAQSVFRTLSFCKVYQFHDTSSEGPLRQSCPVETANYLQSKGNNLPSFLLFLRNNYPDSYKRIVEYVRDVIPQFQDFYLEPVGNYVSLRWIDTSATDYRFNVHQLSDGSIRFIALTTLLLQPASTMPSVIIIDEPELGLHPYAVAQLAEMIKDASLHSQVLIATQNKDLVDLFDVDDISVVEFDGVSLCTKVEKLDRGDYKQWLEHYSVSELWDKNIFGGRPE